MKHYKDPATNEIYAYEADGSQDDIIPAHFLPLTDDEVSELRFQLNQAIEAAKTYRERRAAEYPSFADQFDLLYHGGYDAWKAAIDVVKTKYPKE
jgi:hypothetical protein